MVKRPVINPIELSSLGESLGDLLTIKATGLIMKLYEIDGVKPRHVRTHTDYDGTISHFVNICYFSRDEKTEADAYLEELRKQFPDVSFEIISTCSTAR